MFEQLKKKFVKNPELTKQEKFIRPYPRPPCGGAYWVARSRKLFKDHPARNDETPTIKKPRFLYYKGIKIIDLRRLSFGLGYQITLETEETMRISYEEFEENVYVND